MAEKSKSKGRAGHKARIPTNVSALLDALEQLLTLEPGGGPDVTVNISIAYSSPQVGSGPRPQPHQGHNKSSPKVGAGTRPE